MTYKTLPVVGKAAKNACRPPSRHHCSIITMVDPEMDQFQNIRPDIDIFCRCRKIKIHSQSEKSLFHLGNQ